MNYDIRFHPGLERRRERKSIVHSGRGYLCFQAFGKLTVERTGHVLVSPPTSSSIAHGHLDAVSPRLFQPREHDQVLGSLNGPRLDAQNGHHFIEHPGDPCRVVGS